MKRLILPIIALLIFTTSEIYGQCPPPGQPLPSIDDCDAAPLLCLGVDSYCNTLNNVDTPEGFPGCPANALNNDEWLSFIAGSTTITLEITPSNCVGNAVGSGIQGAIYEGCGGTVMATMCGCTENAFTLTSANYTIGTTYYLVLDGCAGDVCDYTIDITAGSTSTPTPDAPGPITGDINVCPGSNLPYSVPIATGASIYNWTISPPIGTVSGTSNSVNIDWFSAGVATLCVETSNGCSSNPIPSCIVVNSQPIPPTQEDVDFCLGDCVTCAGQVLCSPGLHQITLNSYQGCDSVVLCVLTPILIPPTDLGSITICAPDTYEVCGTVYDFSQQVAENCVGSNDCDSLVIADLAILNPQVIIDPPGDLGCGSDATLILDGSNSTFSLVPNATTTYNWTGPGIIGNDDGTTITIDQPGTYCLTMTRERDGVSCSDTQCVDVFEDIAVPDPPVIFGNDIVCEGDMETYSASSFGGPMPTGYSWSTSNGESIVTIDMSTISVIWDTPGFSQLCVTADNDCGPSAPTCLPITINAAPIDPVIDGPATVCESTPGSFFISNPDPDATYSWVGPAGSTVNGSGSAVTIDFSGSTSGDVCVTCTNSCGTSNEVCIPVDVETPPAPPVFDSGETAVCDGDVVTYCMINDPSATDYTWIGPNGNLPGTDFCNTIDWTGLNGGQICVTANNDCGSSEQTCFDVTVSDAPTASLSIAGDNDFCAGSGDLIDLTVNVTGTGPWTVDYTIDNVAQTPLAIDASPFTFSSGDAGVYVLTSVSDATGCAGVVSGEVTLIENPLPTVSISGGGSICAGSGATVDLTITLTGSPNWTVNWTLGGVDQAALNIDTSSFTLSISETQAGEVAITDVTDGNGCSNTSDGSTATVIVNDAPVVSNIVVACNNTNSEYTVQFEISGGDPDSYSVSPLDGTLTDMPPYIFTSNLITSGDGYMFVVNDVNNCNPVTVQDDEFICDCETAVGSMDLTPVDVCGDDIATLIYDTTNQNFDGDDIVEFILHSGSGASIEAPIYLTDPLPNFAFDMASGMQYGVTYYVSAVVGNDDGSGSVVLNDGCTQVAQGTPITFYELPTAVLSNATEICVGETASLTIDFTGVAPWTIEYDDGSGMLVEESGINTNPFTLNVTPTTETIYTLVSVSDNICDGTASGVDTVVVNTAVQIENEMVVCNGTGTAFTVSFEISGGDPNSYTVNNSTDGIVFGNPTIFTSPEIAEGSGFSFVIDDANSCNPVTFEQLAVDCSCLTAVGTMDAVAIDECGDGPISGTYDDTMQNLDDDDALSFILHSGSGSNIQTPIIGTNSVPDFSFDSGSMTYGTTYFLSAVTGNDDGNGGVDLSDVCLQVAPGTPVTFYEIPTATLSGDTAVCAGQEVNLLVMFTGDSPWEIVIGDGVNMETVSDINNNPFTYTTTVSTSGIYMLESVNDANCPGTIDGDAMVTINEAPTTSMPVITFNDTNTGYTVTFEISGGDDTCYEVTGDQGDLVGNIFTSAEIACGNGYTFFVDDCNGCGPVTVEDPMVLCSCTTQVGEMDTNENLSACGTASVTATYLGTGEVLDGDDIVAYIIHNGDGVPLGNNSVPTFDVSSVGFDFGTTYFISAVAGSDNGNGNIDFSDPCLSISAGTPVVFNEEPSATLSDADTICVGETAILNIEFGGPGPWSFTYSIGNGNTFTENGITDNPYAFMVSPSATEVYNLVDVSNDNCTVTASGLGIVTVPETPTVANVLSTPDASNVNYVVTFTIAGGDANSYTVTGDPGTLNGNMFTSDPIPCGDGYSFAVDDANGCGPVIVSEPQVVCACVSTVGAMQTDLAQACEGDMIAVTYNDQGQFLDGNDVIMFVLHTSSTNILGTIIATNSTPSFNYDPGLVMVGTTYYISAVVGDDDGMGMVDLSDPCLSVSPGTPIVFNPIPTASLTGDATICIGETANATLNMTGVGPYTITYIDENGDTQTISAVNNDQISVSPAATGSYTLTLVSVEDITGCFDVADASVTIDVNEPANAGTFLGAQEVCQGDGDIVDLNTLLENADGNGEWRNSINQVVSNNFNTSGLPAGTYDFTYAVASPAPCPEVTVEVQVIVNQLPVADAGEDRELNCDVLEVSIGGQNTSVGNYTYQWSGGLSTDERIQSGITEPGTYTLTVIDNETGCMASDEMTIVQDLTQPIPFISVSGTSCFGESDGFISVDSITGGAGPYQCAFNGGPYGIETQFNNLSAGVYEVTCIDSKGCEVTIEVFVEQPPELDVNLIGNFDNENNLVALGDSLEIQVQVTLPFDSLDAVIWSPAGAVPCDTCDRFFITPQNELSLSITVVENGCEDSDNLTMYVSKQRDIYVANIFSPNDDGQNDNLEIFAGPGVARIKEFRVFNRWGEVVFQRLDFLPGTQTGAWDGTHRGEELNPAVFTWFAEVEFVDGQSELFTGDAALVK